MAITYLVLVEHPLRRAWQDFEPRLRAFDASDRPARWVHHDLVPANVLDSGERLVLIDWEYAPVGHPEIDPWSVDPESCSKPFIAEMMSWINALWERLLALDRLDRDCDWGLGGGLATSYSVISLYRPITLPAAV